MMCHNRDVELIGSLEDGLTGQVFVKGVCW